jgi:hypothetical protein
MALPAGAGGDLGEGGGDRPTPARSVIPAGDVVAGGEEVALLRVAARAGGDEVVEAVVGVARPGG